MENKFNAYFIYFKLFMGLVYIALGLYIIFAPPSNDRLIPASYAPVVGILLIIYGLFRAYRAYFIDRVNKEQQ